MIAAFLPPRRSTLVAPGLPEPPVRGSGNPMSLQTMMAEAVVATQGADVSAEGARAALQSFAELTEAFAAKLDELQRVSGLVEAANINADEGEISYKIGSMLNAQM